MPRKKSRPKKTKLNQPGRGRFRAFTPNIENPPKKPPPHNVINNCSGMMDATVTQGMNTGLMVRTGWVLSPVGAAGGWTSILAGVPHRGQKFAFSSILFPHSAQNIIIASTETLKFHIVLSAAGGGTLEAKSLKWGPIGIIT